MNNGTKGTLSDEQRAELLRLCRELRNQHSQLREISRVLRSESQELSEESKQLRTNGLTLRGVVEEFAGVFSTRAHQS